MKHPDCVRPPTECRITMVGSRSTLMAFNPVYDGDGNLANAPTDPNIQSTDYACATCAAEWTVDQVMDGQSDATIMTKTAPV